MGITLTSEQQDFVAAIRDFCSTVSESAPTLLSRRVVYQNTRPRSERPRPE